MANAYSFGEVLPVEVVTNNNNTIVDLIERDFNVSVGAGLIDQWTTIEKNVYDTFPLIEIIDPHAPEDTANPLITEFVAFEGGTAYQTTQTYTPFVPVPPTLDETKATGLVQAQVNAQAFLDGGFFFDDGGGSVLYDSDEFSRSNYTTFGVQGNIIGDSFTISIRDSALNLHAFNNAQWEGFYNAFFDHSIQSRDDLETAQLAIIAATTEQEVQDALDAMPPPNDTL